MNIRVKITYNMAECFRCGLYILNRYAKEKIVKNSNKCVMLHRNLSKLQNDLSDNQPFTACVSLPVHQVMMPRVAVIGAGAVGLSTANLVQRRIPGVDITIIADKFDKDTTSDGAAGIFRPSKNKTPGVPIPLLR